MRSTLFIVVAVAFVACIHANQVHFDSPVELGDDSTVQVGTPAPTPPTATPTKPDVAECYQNDATQAKSHCQSKITEATCSTTMADWYCDQSQHVMCNEATPYACSKVLPGATDQPRDALCCVWASGACDLDVAAPTSCDTSVNGAQ